MSAVTLRDCENIEEYSSKIQSYVNDFNLCADTNSLSTGGGRMPKSEHSYYLMKGVPKDDDWKLFTQVMVKKMKAHEARHQQEVDLESIELLALAKTQRKSEKWNSQQTWKSQKSCESGSESESSNSEDEKMHRRTNWRDTP
jgi:viroplasmin and RNaseH domain-containing protein